MATTGSPCSILSLIDYATTLGPTPSVSLRRACVTGRRHYRVFLFFLPGFPVVPFVSWCVRRLAQPMVSIVGQVFHLARVRQPHKRRQFWAFPLLPPISVILNSNWSYWSFDRFDSTFMGSSVLLWALFFGFTRLGHFLLVLTGFLLYLFVLGSMVISLGPAN